MEYEYESEQNVRRQGCSMKFQPANLDTRSCGGVTIGLITREKIHCGSAVVDIVEWMLLWRCMDQTYSQ